MSIESILIPKTKTPKQYVKSLDHQIEAVLNNKSLPTDSKYQLYRQVLMKWDNLSENLSKPIKLDVNRSTQPMSTQDGATIAATFPKTYQSKAQNLVQFIKALPEVQTGDDGVLTINGRQIRNSNFVDILHDFIRKKKTRPPVGARELATVLKHNNVPRELIGNPNRLGWFDPQYTEQSPYTYSKNGQWTEY